jgi:hypothetical protein
LAFDLGLGVEVLHGVPLYLSPVGTTGQLLLLLEVLNGGRLDWLVLLLDLSNLAFRKELQRNLTQGHGIQFPN